MSTGPFGLLMGTERLIVGVEDDPDDPALLRVYMDARYLWRYVLVADVGQQEMLRRAWAYAGGHLTMPAPDAWYVDEDALARSRPATS